MKANVEKDVCIGCGLCESICPEVFAIEDDGKSKAIVEEVEDSLKESAVDARDQCPVAAINIEE